MVPYSRQLTVYSCRKFVSWLCQWQILCEPIVSHDRTSGRTICSGVFTVLGNRAGRGLPRNPIGIWMTYRPIKWFIIYKYIERFIIYEMYPLFVSILSCCCCTQHYWSSCFLYCTPNVSQVQIKNDTWWRLELWSCQQAKVENTQTHYDDFCECLMGDEQRVGSYNETAYAGESRWIKKKLLLPS